MLSSEIIFARRVNEIALCTAPTNVGRIVSFEKNGIFTIFGTSPIRIISLDLAKKGPSVMLRRGTKNTSRFYQKRHILLWQVVLLLAYFGTRILLSLFDT